MSIPSDVCVADGGLINPEMFPCRSADLDTSLINASADTITAIGSEVDVAAQDAQTAWRGLQSPGVFETPEREAVYALMTPAVNGASDMKGVTTRVASALNTYASDLAPIKEALENLESRAAAFRIEALNGYEVTNLEARGSFAFMGYWEAAPVAQADMIGTSMDPMGMTTIPWSEHGPAVERNEQLLAEYRYIIERVSTAAAACANAINAELGTQCVAPVQVLTAELLEAHPELSTWGQPITEDRNCTESVGHGLGNFWHGLWTGGASLIGRDAITGQWSGATAAQSWLGVGDFALSTVVVLLTADMYTEEGMWLDDRRNVAATAWGSLIGWDHQAHLADGNGWHRWEEDGVASFTESAANIGTFFIPVAGWAGGTTKTVLSGTRVGSIIVKTATHASEFLLPGGSHLLTGAVRVVDLGADGMRAGWRTLLEGFTPTTLRPSAAPGILNAGNIPAHTPVSQALGLDTPTPRIPEGSSRPGPELTDGTLRQPENPSAHPDGPGAPRDGGASEADRGSTGPARTESADLDGGHNPRDRGESADWGDTDSWGGVARSDLEPDLANPGGHTSPYQPALGATDSGPGQWLESPRTQDSAGMANQIEHSGVLPSDNGKVMEYRVDSPAGNPVDFDNFTHRGHPPVEVYQEFKGDYSFMDKPWIADSRRAEIFDGMVKQAERQARAVPDGTLLEWYFLDPDLASRVLDLFDESAALRGRVRVYVVD